MSKFCGNCPHTNKPCRPQLHNDGENSSLSNLTIEEQQSDSFWGKSPASNILRLNVALGHDKNECNTILRNKQEAIQLNGPQIFVYYCVEPLSLILCVYMVGLLAPSKTPKSYALPLCAHTRTHIKTNKNNNC